MNRKNDQNSRNVIFNTYKISVSKWKSSYEYISRVSIVFSFVFAVLSLWIGSIGLAFAIFLLGLSALVGFGIKYANEWIDDKSNWKALVCSIIFCFIYGFCLYSSIRVFLSAL